jgi:hypothetical protein
VKVEKWINERGAVRGDATWEGNMKNWNTGGRRWVAWSWGKKWTKEWESSGRRGMNRLLELEVATRTWRKSWKEAQEGELLEYYKQKKRKNFTLQEPDWLHYFHRESVTTHTILHVIMHPPVPGILLGLLTVEDETEGPSWNTGNQLLTYVM